MVGKFSPTIAFKVFDCQILPILEYGSDIWYTGDDVNDLEKNHLKFNKSTLGVRKQTPTPAIYDTGWLPLIIRQHIKAVKYKNYKTISEPSSQKCLQYASWAEWHWFHELVFPYSICPRANLAPVAEIGYSHRLTAYKIVGYCFGLSYRKISGSNQVKNMFFWNQ